MKSIALIIAGMLAHPALAADKFDLVCKGNERINGSASRPFLTELRIDLTDRRYCSDACEATFPIYSFDEQNIVFEASKLDANDPGGTSHHWVKRTTGEYNNSSFPMIPSTLSNRDLYRISTATSFDQTAVCEPVPFKGFPTPKTKF